MPENQELLTAIEAVRSAPEDASHWELVEDLLDRSQEPAEVNVLFQELLQQDLSPDLLSDIGPRALRFYEAWYGDDSSELPETLERILEIDPQASWAFERLTVAYTVAEKWNQLLSAYDNAIKRADQTVRRMQLLEEAAQAAKDFAGQPDRAIDYMMQLLALDPDNNSLAASVERLMERQERYADLISLLQARLSVQSQGDRRATRLRIAAVEQDRLGNSEEALQVAKEVLLEAPGEAAALRIVDRILNSERASVAVRQESLQILKQAHLGRGAHEAVVDVLEASLGFTSSEDRVSTLRELIELLTSSGDDVRALRHQAELLCLTPTPREREALLALAQRTQDFETYQRALGEAADAARPEVGAELRMEAGRVLSEQLRDSTRAIAYYSAVFETADKAQSLAAGRKLLPLLSETDRKQDTLDVCARLSELEDDELVRRRLLGQVARLADELGDTARARRAWQARVGEDTEDVEALDALLQAAQEAGEWTRVAELLRARIKAPAAAERRRDDLSRLATILSEHLDDAEGAIDAWREIQALFGEDQETVTALVNLLSRAERWQELAEVLAQAAGREVSRFTELQTQLGDAFRLRLDRPVDGAERYRAALQVDPEHGPALEGMSALLQDPACQKLAASALSEAYVRTDAWQARLGLLEPRLLTVESSEAKVGMLKEAAHDYEQRGDDAPAALQCLRRAFALAPHDRGIEREIRRLAEQLSAWDAVVSTYRETIATLPDDSPRAAELRFDEAEVLERRVGDRAQALRAYQQALSITPAKLEFALAVARLAGQLDRTDDVVGALIELCRAQDRVDPAMMAVIEQVCPDAAHWSKLTAAALDALPKAKLSTALLRELYCWVARIERDVCEDQAQAERALLRATAVDPSHEQTLRLLAEVQRQQPGKPLIDTLLQLVDHEPHNLDPLWEACDVAFELGEPELSQQVLQRLYEVSSTMFRRGREASGEQDCQSTVSWALERLVHLHREAGRSKRALSLLEEAVGLPFEAEAIQGLRHEAAQLAVEEANEPLRAMDIYRDILALDPRDTVATERLGRLYRDADRLPELLMLCRNELAEQTDEDRKLQLRLDIADVLGELERRGGRVAALLDNLAQSPGHRRSLEVLSAMLREKSQPKALSELLGKQAAVLAKGGQTERAGELYLELAKLQENELHDSHAALEAYRALHSLAPKGEVTAEVARLYADLGEHATAAKWLEQYSTGLTGAERSAAVLKLAQEHVAAKHEERARAVLVQLLSDHPADNAARQLLSEIHRRAGRYETLAELLFEGAQYADSDHDRLAMLVEVADLYHGKLGAPELAAPALERAREFAPNDERLGALLAKGLRAAGRYDEAAAVLQQLIEGYGRRRSPERADLHYQLACVLDAGGDREGALSELETATKMDLAHVAALHLLARLSRRKGDLERAERAYRGLLLLARRQHSENVDDLGPSEVFIELHGIATERGQAEQADELIRSAFEIAGQSDVEAQRLQKVLLKRGDAVRALQVIETRLSTLDEPTQLAEVWAAKADVLEQHTERSGDAFEARLRAIELEPRSDALHVAARASAQGLSSVQRYLDACARLSEEAARSDAPEAAVLAAELQLRMGQAIEQDLQDLDRAAAIYGKVEASGVCVVEAWLSMARVAGARGEEAEQRRVLLQISELDDSQATPKARNDAAFLLAELAISRGAGGTAQAVEYVERALSHEPDYARGRELLRKILRAAPDSEPALALLARVARASRDDELLLDWHMRSAALPGAELPVIRQGIELALKMGLLDRAENLLHLAAEIVRSQPDAREGWVFAGLSECRAQAGDQRGAIECLREALSFAEGSEAQQLRRELAELASREGGDLRVAVEAYEGMLEHEPGARHIWEPLMEAYCALGDADDVDAFVARLLPGVVSAEGRRDLQLVHARFLIAAGAELRAVAPLEGVLTEAPAHVEATELLMGLYQRNDMVDALAQLLFQQFDRVRDQQNVDGVVEIGLRLGSLYPPDRAHEAIDVYRAALEWAPTDERLLQALLERLGPDVDPRERAELMHALLRTESGESAAALADSVATLWEGVGDEERMQEALELGYRACPTAGAVRLRLEHFYVEREMWKPLADLMMVQGQHHERDAEAVALFKNAASLYRDHIGDAEAAADALRAALNLSPGDQSLLGELCRNLAAAGKTDQAIADVSELIDGHESRDAVLIDLLRVRADLLRSSERHADAVADLEAAYGIEPKAVAAELIDSLDVLKGQAFLQADRETERRSVLRLVQLYDEAGQPEQAREVLAQWCEAEANDVETLRALRERDEHNGRFEDVAWASRRLIGLEQGEARVEAALSLAAACERLERPQEAQEGLERVFQEMPDNRLLRERLRQLYESIGAHRELAQILLTAAADESLAVDERIDLYQRVAESLLSVDDAEGALEPLARARELAPEDRRNELLMVDILLKLGDLGRALSLLEEAIESHKRRRTPELAVLQQRMARLCALSGDRDGQMQWLQQASDTDRKNGEIASEMVEAAMAVEDYDGAMKALRNITMMEDPQPITRAMAFFKQAQIAVMRGDTRRAQHWARKAKSLDDGLSEADVLLEQIGG